LCRFLTAARPAAALNDLLTKGALGWNRNTESEFGLAKFVPRPGAAQMAARRSPHRHWFLRDIPRTYVLLVWLAFGVAILIYANDWHPSGWTALRHEAAVKQPPANKFEPYTGSIIFVPTRGEDCQEIRLDNRTGKMWDKGAVNCTEAVSRSEREQLGGMSSLRMDAIGKAFNHR
jgi:hypothetical protein